MLSEARNSSYQTGAVEVDDLGVDGGHADDVAGQGEAHDDRQGAPTEVPVDQLRIVHVRQRGVQPRHHPRAWGWDGGDALPEKASGQGLLIVDRLIVE